ncbi:MGMT family protein [Bacillus sp. OAE603]|uniref:MGMT family protein n=1 Tax=Gottfriedia sp. OAE603 TaxID=2663872 RepID=UPI00178A4F21
MNTFTSNVIEVIRRIPKGKVMTYGQIAKHAGSPRGARQVVRILHSMSQKYNLPWHRVVNSKGEIGIKDEEGFLQQKNALEEEGITFIRDRKIDLNMFQYEPIPVLEKADVDLI